MMWSLPVYNERDNSFIFFLGRSKLQKNYISIIFSSFSDTQGLNSGKADQDAIFLSLSSLLSSYLIFNTVGAITEKTLSQIEHVTSLPERIAISNNTTSNEGEDNEAEHIYILSYYMPKFLWILRDAGVEIKDNTGKIITPTVYMDNYLYDYVDFIFYLFLSKFLIK